MVLQRRNNVTGIRQLSTDQTDQTIRLYVWTSKRRNRNVDLMVFSIRLSISTYNLATNPLHSGKFWPSAFSIGTNHKLYKLHVGICQPWMLGGLESRGRNRWWQSERRKWLSEDTGAWCEHTTGTWWGGLPPKCTFEISYFHPLLPLKYQRGAHSFYHMYCHQMYQSTVMTINS